MPTFVACGHPKVGRNALADGKYICCRICKVARAKMLRQSNPEKSRAAARAWSKANPERHAKLAWRSRLKIQLGVGAPEHFEEQIKMQQGFCAICKQLVGKSCSDHSHSSGKWRGVLCNPCNQALGLLKDSIPVLESAIAYLKKWA
jgi:hypothetical protein